MRARLPAGLDILRDRIRALEQGGRNTTGVLPFGVKDLDRHLPSGGLSLGAVHEIAGGGATSASPRRRRSTDQFGR